MATVGIMTIVINMEIIKDCNCKWQLAPITRLGKSRLGDVSLIEMM